MIQLYARDGWASVKVIIFWYLAYEMKLILALMDVFIILSDSCIVAQL